MPLPTWNHIYADGDGFNWQDASILNMYIAAFLERGVDFSGFGPFVAGATGYNLQAILLWQAMQNYFVTFSAGSFTNVIGHWIKPIDLTGIRVDGTGASGFAFYELPSLSPSWMFDNAKTPSGAYAFAGADGTPFSSTGFTAKYPKAFATLASGSYDDFMAFTLGDYARCKADGLVYHREVVSGSPAWVKSPTHLPDKRLASEGGFRSARAFGSPGVSLPLGIITHGDILGPWLMNEMRDAINMLTAHLGPVSALPATFSNTSWISGGSNNSKDGSDAETPGTAATAKAAALAAYANSGTVDSAPYAWTHVTDDGTNASAVVSRREAKASSVSDADGLTPAVDFYSFMTGPEPATSGGFPVTFDANGDTIDQLVFTKFNTQAAAGAGADVVSAFVGSLAAPNWSANNAYRGYGFSGFFGGAAACMAVFRYNLAGGFVYRP